LGQAFEELLENLQSSRQQVIQAAKLAVVGEMAAIMAHEVRTPLGILHTTAQMLRRDADLKPRSREMTGMILEETERLGRLITTLLECASPRPPQMSRQNLHEILDRVAELLKVQALRKQIRIERDYCAQDPVISCDGELMVQVFLNLILNAIQILPRGGRIVLRSLTRENDLNIEIHDDGPGIPQIQKERVFDPFFTTREGGIGLGLTVTQQIIATHGGSIAAEGSELGGACFRICLPESREEVR
jgi:signal transduction histidine kinase